jgi:hypothetical protein
VKITEVVKEETIVVVVDKVANAETAEKDNN